MEPNERATERTNEGERAPKIGIIIFDTLFQTFLMEAFIKLMRTTINTLQTRQEKKFIQRSASVFITTHSIFRFSVISASPTFVDYRSKRLSYDENEMKKKKWKKLNILDKIMETKAL